MKVIVVLKDEAGLEASVITCVTTGCLEALYAYLRVRMEYGSKINTTPAPDLQVKCKGLSPEISRMNAPTEWLTRIC